MVAGIDPAAGKDVMSGHEDVTGPAAAHENLDATAVAAVDDQGGGVAGPNRSGAHGRKN